MLGGLTNIPGRQASPPWHVAFLQLGLWQGLTTVFYWLDLSSPVTYRLVGNTGTIPGQGGSELSRGILFQEAFSPVCQRHQDMGVSLQNSIETLKAIFIIKHISGPASVA